MEIVSEPVELEDVVVEAGAAPYAEAPEPAPAPEPADAKRRAPRAKAAPKARARKPALERVVETEPEPAPGGRARACPQDESPQAPVSVPVRAPARAGHRRRAGDAGPGIAGPAAAAHCAAPRDVSLISGIS